MSRYKKYSDEELINMGPGPVRKMRREELQDLARQYQNFFRRREATFKRAGIKYSPAISVLKRAFEPAYRKETVLNPETGAEETREYLHKPEVSLFSRFRNRKSKLTMGGMRRYVAKMQRFFNPRGEAEANTNTVQGYLHWAANQDEMLFHGTYQMTQDEREEFWNKYQEFMRSEEAASYDYRTVMDALANIYAAERPADTRSIIEELDRIELAEREREESFWKEVVKGGVQQAKSSRR